MNCGRLINDKIDILQRDINYLSRVECKGFNVRSQLLCVTHSKTFKITKKSVREKRLRKNNDC